MSGIAITPAPGSIKENEPPAPEREYSAEENKYFRRTIFALGFEPKTHARPTSVTDDDIIARANDCRRRYGLPLLKPAFDPSGALIVIHERPAAHTLQLAPSRDTLEVHDSHS